MKIEKNSVLTFFKHFFALAAFVLIVLMLSLYSSGIISEHTFKIMDAAAFFCSAFTLFSSMLQFFEYKKNE